MTIYIHTYGVGKFGNEIHRSVHDTKASAEAQQKVLGGKVDEYVHSSECVDLFELEDMRTVMNCEVSEIIDGFSSDSPGSPGSYEVGGSEWDCCKVAAMNKVNGIFDGDYQ